MSANESKRRSEPRPIDNISSFQYQPLEEGVDCTRFLSIQPAKNDGDPTISCALNHIAFGEKPSYEALSYRWGEEAPVHTIVLNGHPFIVRKNLHDALLYLRNRGNGGLLWVDAICIDQTNVQERNRQVAIMRHIYFRAQTVIVWLGKKYSKWQEGMGTLELRFASENTSGDETLGCSDDSDPPNDAHAARLTIESDMVHQLAKDEYWKRVWIIQEIGLANQRRVCFGNMAMHWNSFIKMMTLHSTIVEGPVLLNQQIERKSEGSHKLRSLLYNHRYSQCKDHKDKIYGLIGLAVDGYGFPKPDYSKPPIQIWTDTMEFMNSHKLFDERSESDIIFCGTLVKYLLMGTQSTPVQQVLGPYGAEAEPQLIHMPEVYPRNRDSRVFGFKGYVVGCIQCIGPSTKDIAGNLEKVDEWSFHVQVNYRHDVGAAYEQSSNLLRALLAKKDSEISRLCSNQTSLVIWTGWANSGVPHGDYMKWFEDYKNGPEATESTSLSETSSGTEGTVLYQLYTEHPTCRRSRDKWRMGVASGQVERGDLVCWVRDTKTALVVRPTEKFKQGCNECAKFQVIGTAIIAEDIADSKIDHSPRLDFLKGFRQGTMDLKFDARTVYMILP
ncbi:hypothetical protein CSIM01_05148 [Colletotrichum simmondsii]|uniref:Heterokaryon incompatibility domain-containing protein n=1 Tax=Colletotrichum simmondsii TaxID=703756 RepID=A0A135SAT4_9PEZI|nr:hypothetical protein CSIM01_05148 [Colletotrichum simmondsii]